MIASATTSATFAPATHGVGELAQRLLGSPDIFNKGGRTAAASVNFITAHDGFSCAIW